MPKVPKITSAISFQYLKENLKDEVDFLPTDKHRFLQIDTIVLGVCVAGHAQITQNSKFDISLQFLTNEVIDEVDFLHADEHKGFLQINTMVLIWMVKHSQNSKFAMSLQYLKQEVRNEVDFLFTDKHQS